MREAYHTWMLRDKSEKHPNISRKSHFHCIHLNKTYSFWLRLCCQCHFCFPHGDRSNSHGLQVGKIIGQHRMPHICSVWDVRVQEKTRSTSKQPPSYHLTTFPDQIHRTRGNSSWPRLITLNVLSRLLIRMANGDLVSKCREMAGFFGRGSFCWKPFLKTMEKGNDEAIPYGTGIFTYMNGWLTWQNMVNVGKYIHILVKRLGRVNNFVKRGLVGTIQFGNSSYSYV